LNNNENYQSAGTKRDHPNYFLNKEKNMADVYITEFLEEEGD
jgi:hypothetical protein